MVDANNVAWHIVKGFLRLIYFFEKIEHIHTFNLYLQEAEKNVGIVDLPRVLL